MSILAPSGVYGNQIVTDGFHSVIVTIMYSTAYGTIINHDNWTAITFHSCLCVSYGNNSNSAIPHVQPGDLPCQVKYTDLQTDGTQNNTGMATSTLGGSVKNVLLHKTNGDWRLMHGSHGHNYQYLVTFSLSST